MGPARIEILRVTHGSSVAAISTAAGPAALLEAGLERRLRELGTDVAVTEVSLPSDAASNPVADSFAMADILARAVRAALASGRLPVVLAGSCHTGLGATAGLPPERRGVVWLDAHADFNTPETTPSGLLDGTTLATITGRCWRRMAATVDGFEPVADEAVALMGVRRLDPGEEELLAGTTISRLAADAPRSDVDSTLDHLAGEADHVYVHLDLDVLDAAAGRANAWAAPGGVSAERLPELAAAIARRTPARVLGVTSYDPSTDDDGRAAAAGLAAVVAFVGERQRLRAPGTLGPHPD